MAEWPIAPVLKTGTHQGSWVRIPVPPMYCRDRRERLVSARGFEPYPTRAVREHVGFWFKSQSHRYAVASGCHSGSGTVSTCSRSQSAARATSSASVPVTFIRFGTPLSAG